MPPVISTRKPIIDLKSVISSRQPLIVDQTPFQQGRDEIRRFMKCLEGWAEAHQNELVEEEDAHLKAMMEGGSEVKRLKGDIEERKRDVEKIIENIGLQQAELQKSQEAVGEQRAKRQKQQNLKNMLTQEIEQVKTSIARLRAVHEADERALDAQLALVAPECEQYTRRLGIDFEAIREDVLRVKFSHLDPTDLGREFTLILDVSHNDYRAPSSDPQLSSLPLFVKTLNAERDMGNFLKRVRHAFEEYIREERG